MPSQTELFLNMLKKEHYIVLDTETTGLKNAEICQIAIIANTGQILIDTLVKPTRPIPHRAWRIHGISNEMVFDAPGWAQVGLQVYAILSEYDNLVVYNAKFDRHMIYSSEEHADVKKQLWEELITWWCAMEAYADMHGNWSEYHQSATWVKLGAAAREMEIRESDRHSALGDCQTTLDLVQALAME